MSAGLQEIRRSQGLDFQKKFLKVFNSLYPESYQLVPSVQEFEIFDYYLFKKEEIEPYIIEFKTRPGKYHNTFQDTLFDYLKLIKLRALSRKAKVLICFEDVTLIVDCNELPFTVGLGLFDGIEKPVAFYEVSKLKQLSIGLQALRLIE